MLLDFHSKKLGVGICFEAMFPWYIRSIVEKGAQALAVISSDDSFNSSATSKLLIKQISLRAIENKRDIIRTTRSGISAVIDAQGKIKGMTSQGTQEVLNSEIQPHSQKTFYTKNGKIIDYIIFALGLLFFGSIFIFRIWRFLTETS